QRVIAAGHASLKRAHETARRRGGLGSGLDHCIGPRALGCRDLVALVGFDGFQNVGHQALETLIRRCNRPSASPESSDFAAIATPSFKSLARPATIRDAAALRIAISRYGPLVPLSTEVSAVALVSASPPLSASGLARAIPMSSG